jgi:hypothetical protein
MLLVKEEDFTAEIFALSEVIHCELRALAAVNRTHAVSFGNFPAAFVFGSENHAISGRESNASSFEPVY